MHRSNLFARGACISALILLSASPAIAGKADRARAAIAQAKGKIDAANKVGASGEVPHMQARAQAALATAEEDLARGNKEQAISDANHASELADVAIGESQKNKAAAERAQHADAAVATSVAQQDAAAANARADSAQQAAAVSAAQAAALRNAPAPAPSTTIVTQEKVVQRSVVPAKKTVRRVVHRPASTLAEKTTTTVTTAPNQ